MGLKDLFGVKKEKKETVEIKHPGELIKELRSSENSSNKTGDNERPELECSTKEAETLVKVATGKDRKSFDDIMSVLE